MCRICVFHEKNTWRFFTPTFSSLCSRTLSCGIEKQLRKTLMYARTKNALTIYFPTKPNEPLWRVITELSSQCSCQCCRRQRTVVTCHMPAIKELFSIMVGRFRDLGFWKIGYCCWWLIEIWRYQLSNESKKTNPGWLGYIGVMGGLFS